MEEKQKKNRIVDLKKGLEDKPELKAAREVKPDPRGQVPDLGGRGNALIRLTKARIFAVLQILGILILPALGFFLVFDLPLYSLALGIFGVLASLWLGMIIINTLILMFNQLRKILHRILKRFDRLRSGRTAWQRFWPNKQRESLIKKYKFPISNFQFPTVLWQKKKIKYSAIACLILVSLVSTIYYWQATRVRAVAVGIEQQINIIDQEYSNTSGAYVPTDNSLGLIEWEGSKYNNETIYFEAILQQTNGGPSPMAYAALFDSDGNQVSGSEVNTIISWTRVRSNSISLTDGKKYTVRIKAEQCDANIQAARLIVVQSGTKITDTETQIEVGANESSGNTATSTLTDPKYYMFDADKFNPAPTAYFEATIKGGGREPSQVYSYTTYASAGTEAGYTLPVPTDHPDGDLYIAWLVKDDNVEPTYPSSPHTWTNQVYSAEADGAIWCSLHWWWGSSEPASGWGITGDTGEEYTGSIIRIASTSVDSTDPIIDNAWAIGTGDTEPSAPSVTPDEEGALILHFVGHSAEDWFPEPYPANTTGLFAVQTSGGGNGSVLNGAAYRTEVGVGEASGVANFDTQGANEWCAASIALRPHANNSTSTIYAELYNRTNSEPVTGSLVSTTSTDWVHTRSVAFTTNWDTSADDEYEVRYRTDKASTTGYIANAKIVLEQSQSTGIDAVEMVHQYVNNLSSDAGTWAAQDYDNLYDADNFTYGSFTKLFEATIKNNGATAEARLSGPLGAISKNSASYARATSSSLTLVDDTVYDTEIQYAHVSSSWLVIQASGLAPLTISSAQNQDFAVGDATTTSEVITIIDGPGGNINTTNDIVIAIATGTVDMRFDPYVTTITRGGDDSTYISASVTYSSDNALCYVTVDTNFSMGDNITITGLKFVNFNSANAAASALDLYTNGYDASAEASDDATVTIHGTLTARNHTLGQSSNQWSSDYTSTTSIHYRYQLEPGGETMAMGTTTFNLSSISGISTSDITGAKLIYDTDSNGVYDSYEYPGATSTNWGWGGYIKYDAKNPSYIKAALDGSIYIGGSENNGSNDDLLIIKFDSTGATSTDWGWNNQGYIKWNSGYDDYMRSLSLDSDGNLYVISDFYNVDRIWRIMKFDSAGATSTDWGWNNQGYIEYNAGPFGAPGIAVLDSSKNLYVVGNGYTSTSIGIILKFDSTGATSTDWGQNNQGYIIILEADNTAMRSMAIDSDRNIYVAGHKGYSSNNTEDWMIIKFDANGATSTDWGWGNQGYIYYDYTTDEDDDLVESIIIDDERNIYVFGRYDISESVGGSDPVYRVFKFDSTGATSTNWGWNNQGYIDIEPSVVINPNMFNIDSKNRIYIAGETNQAVYNMKILRFDNNGATSTDWGFSNQGYIEWDSGGTDVEVYVDFDAFDSMYTVCRYGSDPYTWQIMKFAGGPILDYGEVSISGTAGTITFATSTTYTISTTTDFLVELTASTDVCDQMTMDFYSASTTGATSNWTITPTGDPASVAHYIIGTIDASNHSLGSQVTNQWSYGLSGTTSIHYRYSLDPDSTAITLGTTTISLAGVVGVETGDISGIKLYKDSNNDGIISFYGTNIASTTVATSTASTATAYSFQRKTWYDGTRYWTAYRRDQDNRIEFWYSTDGSSWIENISARIAVDTNDFSIEADSENAFIVYSTGGITSDMLTRQASSITSYPGTGFNWGNSTTILEGGCPDVCYSYVFPAINKDTNNRIRVTFRGSVATTYNFKSILSTNSNDITSWGSEEYVDFTSGNANTFGTVILLANGDMYAVWIINNLIKGNKYSGSWGDPTSIADGITGLEHNVSMVSGVTANEAYLVYINSAGYLMFEKYVDGAGWGSTTTLSGYSDNDYPIISVDTSNNKLYVFWIRSNTIYMKTSDSPFTSWSATSTLIDSGTNTWLSAVYQDRNNYINFVYTESSGSPYNVKFYGVNIGDIQIGLGNISISDSSGSLAFATSTAYLISTTTDFIVELTVSNLGTTAVTTPSMFLEGEFEFEGDIEFEASWGGTSHDQMYMDFSTVESNSCTLNVSESVDDIKHEYQE